MEWIAIIAISSMIANAATPAKSKFQKCIDTSTAIANECSDFENRVYNRSFTKCIEYEFDLHKN